MLIKICKIMFINPIRAIHDKINQKLLFEICKKHHHFPFFSLSFFLIFILYIYFFLEFYIFALTMSVISGGTNI